MESYNSEMTFKSFDPPPDPKYDTTLTMDAKTVVVPQGEPMITKFTTSNFSQSEYLIYRESQTRIRYLLKLKFGW